MNKRDLNNAAVAVLAGLGGAFLVSLLLFPLVRIVLNKYFHLYLFIAAPPDAWKDDMIVEVTVYLWVLIAFVAGGIFCTLIAKKKELWSVLTVIILTFLIANITTKGHLIEGDRMSITVQLLNPIGYLTGWRIAVRHKQTRYKEPEPTF